MLASHRSPEILIVDDNFYLHDFMTKVLQEEGYNVRCASNGQEALDYLRSASEPPALILLDLAMPVMDGRQFRAAQLQDHLYTSIPVVVISSDGDGPETAAALSAVACLKKPFTLDQLLHTVSDHLQAPARDRAAP